MATRRTAIAPAPPTPNSDESPSARALAAIRALCESLRPRRATTSRDATALFHQCTTLLCRVLTLHAAEKRGVLPAHFGTSELAHSLLYKRCTNPTFFGTEEPLELLSPKAHSLPTAAARAFIESAIAIDPGLETPAAPLLLGQLYESLLPIRAHFNTRGTLRLETSIAPQSRRKTTGSYYTPQPLIQHLLHTTLSPLIRERLATSKRPFEALRSIRLLDPSCGAGYFLLEAFRELVKALGPKATPTQLATLARECLYGVDLNPQAVELCRLTLWLEVAITTRTSPFTPAEFASTIRRGNALLGTLPDTDVGAIPDEALVTRDDDHPASAAAIRALNKRTPSTPAPAHTHPHLSDAWCAAFLQRRTAATRPHAITTATLNALRDRPPATTATTIPPETTEAISKLASANALFHWHIQFPSIWSGSRQGFDVVIGNPPFLNQLETATATARRVETLARALSKGQLRGYTDLSAAFLLRATQLTAPDGRLCLVQPQSLLAAKDAKPVRDAVLHAACLESLWVSNAHVFKGVSVFTCAPTLRRNGPRRGRLTRSAGAQYSALKPIRVDCEALIGQETWAHLAAAANGIPELSLPASPDLATLATATADFRDQYYGLDGFLIESDALTGRIDDTRFPKLITSGLIDLAHNLWGSIQTRILKQRWNAPRIDRTRMEREGTLGPWLTLRMVPKLLVATQTRVLEVIADEQGVLAPGIPLISVMPKDARDVWRIAAAIASPVASLIAMHRYAGTAMTADAIKLSASQVLGLPLPTHHDAWNAGAALFRAATESNDAAARELLLDTFGQHLCEAYGLNAADTHAVLSWWKRRRVHRRGRVRIG
jgi:hypothetical protein